MTNVSPPHTHAHTSISLHTFTAPLPFHPLPQWPLARVTSSPPPIETPIVPLTAQMPQNANDMLSLHIQTKWHDILQLQVSPTQEWKWWGWVGRAQWIRVLLSFRQIRCSDTDLPIVFLFLWLYFFKVFFSSCFVQWPSNLPPAIVPCCTSTAPTLLHAGSTCLFYLAADSLEAIHSLTCRCPEADMTFMAFKSPASNSIVGAPTSSYCSSPEGNFCCQATILPHSSIYRTVHSSLSSSHPS